MPPSVPSRLAKQYSNLIEGVGENEMFAGLEKSESPIYEGEEEEIKYDEEPDFPASQPVTSQKDPELS